MSEPTYVDLAQTGPEIQAILDTAVIESEESDSTGRFKMAVVSEIPETPDANTMYFVRGE